MKTKLAWKTVAYQTERFSHEAFIYRTINSPGLWTKYTPEVLENAAYAWQGYMRHSLQLPTYYRNA